MTDDNVDIGSWPEIHSRQYPSSTLLGLLKELIEENQRNRKTAKEEIQKKQPRADVDINGIEFSDIYAAIAYFQYIYIFYVYYDCFYVFRNDVFFDVVKFEDFKNSLYFNIAVKYEIMELARLFPKDSVAYIGARKFYIDGRYYRADLRYIKLLDGFTWLLGDGEFSEKRYFIRREEIDLFIKSRNEDAPDEAKALQELLNNCDRYEIYPSEYKAAVCPGKRK